MTIKRDLEGYARRRKAELDARIRGDGHHLSDMRA
jgi:hypothetical protein